MYMSHDHSYVYVVRLSLPVSVVVWCRPWPSFCSFEFSERARGGDVRVMIFIFLKSFFRVLSEVLNIYSNCFFSFLCSKLEGFFFFSNFKFTKLSFYRLNVKAIATLLTFTYRFFLLPTALIMEKSILGLVRLAPAERRLLRCGRALPCAGSLGGRVRYRRRKCLGICKRKQVRSRRRPSISSHVCWHILYSTYVKFKVNYFWKVRNCPESILSNSLQY